MDMRYIYVDPEPDFPVGRKGLVLARTWQTLNDDGKIKGMIVLDGDVAIDPIDVGFMYAAIDETPEDIITAPVRLWPVSTKLEGWIWGHGHDVYGPNLDDGPTTRFSFGYTYLPGALLDKCIEKGMKEWVYPDVDRSVSKVAADMGLTVRLLKEATPKHLNF
jgi:hypothetical protein